MSNKKELTVSPKGLLLMAGVETDIFREEAEFPDFIKFCDRWTELCLKHGFDPFEDLSVLATENSAHKAKDSLKHKTRTILCFLTGFLCGLLIYGIKTLILG